MKKTVFRSVEFSPFMRTALLLAALAIALTAASPARAQEFRGSIKGQVTDPSGAIVAGAKVTAVRGGTQDFYTGTTNGAGDYSIPYVPPGSYSITVEAPGFKKISQEGVILDVAQKLNLNFQLDIGAVTEQVTVQADAAMVNSGDASGGAVLEQEKIQDLPTNGRQIYMLLSLTPGFVFTQTQFGANGFSGNRGWDVNNSYVVNGVSQGRAGNNSGFNQFNLNGAPISRQLNGTGTWEIAPNIEAIQEVKVMTNTYDSQYGRSGGATVNMVLKSGTNDFHGSAFEYVLNSVTSANTFQSNLVGARKGLQNQHQFGGVFSGPIQKNKTYFLFSFEGYREVVPFPLGPVSVPSGVVIQPDGSVNFSGTGFTIYDPLTTHCANSSNPCNSFTRDPFSNDTIPANRIDPAGLKLLKLYPAPNAPGVFSNFFATGLKGRYSYNQPMVKIDREFGEKTHVYGMFAWWRGHEFRNTNGLEGAGQQGNILTERDATTVVLDATHTFSPTKIGDLRISFSRFHSNFPDGALAAGTATLTAGDLGLNMPHIPTTNKNFAPEITLADPYQNMIGNQISIGMDNTYTIAPSLTHIHGRHNFRYGADLWLLQRANPGVGNPNGTFDFGPVFTQKNPNSRGQNDGLGLASMLLGYPDGGSVQDTQTYFAGYEYFGFYFQDDFKLRSNLTLNLGLRWDDERSIKERFNRLNAGFCFTCVNPINSQVKLPATLPDGATPVSQLNGGLLFAGVNGAPDRVYKNYLDHFQPKFGIAWAITSKTVLRAGFGISYATGIEAGTTTGFSQTTGYVSSLDGNLTPTNSFKSGTPFPNGFVRAIGSTLGLMTGLGTGLGFDQPNRQIPRVLQWSLGIQRELPGQVVLDVSYVGTHSSQLRTPYQFNSIPTSEAVAIGPTALLQRLPNPFKGILPPTTGLGTASTVTQLQLMLPFPEFTGAFSNTEPNGTSSYNALQVRFQKRLSNSSAALRNLSIITSFTYSKAMQSIDYLNNGAIQDPIHDFFHRVAPFDRTLSFNVGFVYGLPIGSGGLLAKDAKGPLQAVIGDWQMIGSVADASGVPIGLPNIIFNCPNHPSISVPNPHGGEWLYNENMSCYQNVPADVPRTFPLSSSHLRQPWEPQANVALQKQWKIMENRSLQFKAEAFNVANTVIFGGVNTNINQPPTINPNGTASGFGTINLQQQNFPRQIQFSLKFLF
jgi:hypothetical protein